MFNNNTSKQLKPTSKYILIFLGIFIVLFFAHMPSLKGYFVLHDDLFFWEHKINFSEKHPQHIINVAMGRLIGGNLLTFWGQFVSSVTDLNLLRLICLFQLSICSFITFLCLNKKLSSRINAFLISTIIFTLPPFQVMIFWIGACFHVTALLFSCLAGLFAYNLDLGKPTKKILLDKNSLIAIFFLFCGIMTYASAATFFWALLGLLIFSFREESYNKLKQFVFNFFYVGLSAHLIYFIYLKLTKGFYINQVRGMYNPYVLNTNFFSKLKWFLTEPIYNCLNFWNIFPSQTFASILILFIIIPFIYYFIKTERQYKKIPDNKNLVRREFFCFLAFLVLIPLSYLPNLISAGESPFYRCMPGIMSLFFAIFIWAVVLWIKMFFKTKLKLSFTIVLIVLCIYGSVMSYKTILNFRAKPSQNELAFLIKSLNQPNLKNIDAIYIVPLDSDKIKDRYDEYGILTHPIQRCTRLMIKCALRELGREKELLNKTIGIISANEAKKAKHNRKILVIDFNEEKY